jgi:hypothetical protein
LEYKSAWSHEECPSPAVPPLENTIWFSVVRPSCILLVEPRKDAGFSSSSNKKLFITGKHIEKVRVRNF